MSTLKKKTESALLWNFSSQFISQIVSVVIGIILARLLSPNEYGLMGMAVIFIGLASVIVDFGTGSAIINKKETTRTELSSLFWLNLALGIVVFILINIASSFIAIFFEQPILQYIIMWISSTYILSSINIVQAALIKKNLIFESYLSYSK